MQKLTALLRNKLNYCPTLCTFTWACFRRAITPVMWKWKLNSAKLNFKLLRFFKLCRDGKAVWMKLGGTEWAGMTTRCCTRVTTWDNYCSTDAYQMTSPTSWNWQSTRFVRPKTWNARTPSHFREHDYVARYELRVWWSSRMKRPRRNSKQRAGQQFSRDVHMRNKHGANDEPTLTQAAHVRSCTLVASIPVRHEDHQRSTRVVRSKLTRRITSTDKFAQLQTVNQVRQPTAMLAAGPSRPPPPPAIFRPAFDGQPTHTGRASGQASRCDGRKKTTLIISSHSRHSGDSGKRKLRTSVFFGHTVSTDVLSRTVGRLTDWLGF